MSAAVQQAVLDETLEQAYLFRQNAALNRGLPDCRRISAKLPDDQVAVQPPAPQPINITNNIPAAPAATSSPSPGTAAAPASSSLLRRAAPFLLSAAVGAAPVGGYALWQSMQADPVKPPASITPSDGDLLQELQRQGRHLPEGWPNG